MYTMFVLHHTMNLLLQKLKQFKKFMSNNKDYILTINVYTYMAAYIIKHCDKVYTQK